MSYSQADFLLIALSITAANHNLMDLMMDKKSNLKSIKEFRDDLLAVRNGKFQWKGIFKHYEALVFLNAHWTMVERGKVIGLCNKVLKSKDKAAAEILLDKLHNLCASALHKHHRSKGGCF